MTQWRKSSRSSSTGGNCVELAAVKEAIGVRDSKNPSQGHLTVGREALSGLIGRIKAGELDL
jgi:xanthine/CO dehydrogenase XdhC/CoxF family maturation factor